MTSVCVPSPFLSAPLAHSCSNFAISLASPTFILAVSRSYVSASQVLVRPPGSLSFSLSCFGLLDDGLVVGYVNVATLVPEVYF
ncbi:Protein kinase domain-containing protein [Psidium guajava]|nr:Protein kinase domain-containing protein [Psidium guajava]